MRRGYLALGSNLGDRGENLRFGIGGLRESGVTVRRLSSVWETEPVEMDDPRPFWNMAAEIETALAPHELLERLLQIETRAGRVRRRRNESRALDLDLLLLGDEVVEDERLSLPHPRMWSRRFVLAPLLEIAPGLRDPVSGESIEERIARIAHPARVRRVGMLDRCAPGLL